MSTNHFPFRHSRDELIQIAPHLIPDPLPDVPVKPENYRPVLSTEWLAVGSVEPDERASIFIDHSQRGVEYQLYTEAGDPIGEPVLGNCARIELETAPLPQRPDAEWYEFFILACQPSTGVEIKLKTLIWINAGDIDGVDPRPESLALLYNTPFRVLIPDSQPDLRWELRRGSGESVSAAVTAPEDGGDVNLESVNLPENEVLVIHVFNLKNEREKPLTQTQDVKVYPNPALTWNIDEPPDYAEYDGTIDLYIEASQSSVRYQLMERKSGAYTFPSGDPVRGTGGRIRLTSGRLRDIAFVRVQATKIDGQLVNFLNGELRIKVAPDPTLAVEPAEQIIPYAAQAQITLPEPQPDTAYFLHCGDGVPISDTVLATGDPIVLTSVARQEDCVVIVRAEREQIQNDLHARPKVLVEPNYELEVELPEEYFLRVDGTRILIHATQESVHYSLFKVPSAFGAREQAPIAAEAQSGNGGTLALQTDRLPADQYRFVVRAAKAHSQGDLTEQIDFAVSIRRDLAVSCNPQELDYNRPSFLDFAERQPFIEYRIVDEVGQFQSELLAATDPATQLPSYPLREDTLLQVWANHTLTDVEAYLAFSHRALIAPNPDIELNVPTPNVPFETSVRIDLDGGQASVTYQVSGRARVRGNSAPNPVTTTVQPTSDGAFSIELGPVKWPMTLSILAFKAPERRQLPLGGNPEIAAYPDLKQTVQVKMQPNTYGDSAVVEIAGSDWDTQYRLLGENNQPISNTAATQAPARIELRTEALREDFAARVQAIGLISGLTAILEPRAELAVPPNLTLDAKLVNLPFARLQGAEIEIVGTQASAEYYLEMRGYEESGNSSEPTLSEVIAGGGNVSVPTGALPQLRYEMRCIARKKANRLTGYLPNTIAFFAGVMLQNQVNIDRSVLEYGETSTLTVVAPQPNASYRLIGRGGEPISEVISTGENPADIKLKSYPLYEDVTIRVQVNNAISDAEALLVEEKSVLVYPNPDLNPVLEIAEIAYGGAALILLNNVQRSVRYEFTRARIDDPGAPTNLAPGVVIHRATPNLDQSPLPIYIGPLHYDQTLTVSAVKISSGLRLDFPLPLPIKVGPRPNVYISYERRRLYRGKVVPIVLYKSQKGVKYRLRNAAAPPGEGFVDETVFNHFNVPIGRARVADDLAVWNPGGQEMIMRTPPLQNTIVYEIHAEKYVNGLRAVLDERVHLRLYRRWPR